MAAEPALQVPSTTEHAELRTMPARDLVLQLAANEIIFAVVGHVGSGTSEVGDHYPRRVATT